MNTMMMLVISLSVVLVAACNEPEPQAPPDEGEQADDQQVVARSSALGSMRKLQGPRSAEAQGPQENGELQIFEDQIAFRGNGVNTPTEVMARALEVFAQQDPALKPFATSVEAAYLAAQSALEGTNPKLKGLDPKDAIPAGERFTAGGASDLKKLLAPFKNNLGKLREMVAESQTGLGGKSKATGHGVFSKARTIPVSMNGPGGEPAPQMGDLSALGGPEKKDGGT